MFNKISLKDVEFKLNMCWTKKVCKFVSLNRKLPNIYKYSYKEQLTFFLKLEYYFLSNVHENANFLINIDYQWSTNLTVEIYVMYRITFIPPGYDCELSNLSLCYVTFFLASSGVRANWNITDTLRVESVELKCSGRIDIHF